MNCFLPSSSPRFASIALPALLAFSCAAAQSPAHSSEPPAGGEPAGWVAEASSNGVAIHSRRRPGSSFKEYRGTGVIDAPPASVFAVIDDSEAYPHFMPYTSECRVLKRGKDSVVAYQRLELPLISDRDYTLRSENAHWLGPDGPIYRIHWEPANNLGPAPMPGVLRVNICEGGWLLEPQGSNGTRATYTIYTDSGGTIPPMLANSGSKVAIRKVFEAIRKQVKEPKYLATAKPE
ncbi:MAG: SRPBCC family protein [Chthoniobacterales bacterium]